MRHETSLFCRSVLLTDGWAEDVLLRFDDRGVITAVERGARPGDAQARGPVVPGLPNLHSHAFQRAMAGLAERAGRTEDDFWTWRDTMYRFLARFTPEGLQAVAALLYLEMLKAGYTSVAEFHYLHHDRDGTPYADRAESSHRIVAAARETGIRLTHLPTPYAHGGFGGRAPTEGQKRFLHTVEGLLGVVESVRRVMAEEPAVRVGLALHSLRAVTPEELRLLEYDQRLVARRRNVLRVGSEMRIRPRTGSRVVRGSWAAIRPDRAGADGGATRPARAGIGR